MPNAAGRFTGPWRPGADEFSADPGVLLRADNLSLDEEGIVSLRLGSKAISQADTSRVVDIFSTVLGTRERIVTVDADQIIVDGVIVDGSTLEGGGDIALGAVRGHLLVANGSTKYKYDGTTLRNWGIEAPTDAPAVDVVDVATLTMADFSSASAEFTASEGTKGNTTGYDGVANAATTLTPAVGTGRGIMSHTYAAEVNTLNLGGKGGDFDIFSFWLNDPQPEKFTFLIIEFGLSEGSDPFLTDSYYYMLGSFIEPIQPTVEEVEKSKEKQEAEQPEPEEVPSGGDEDPHEDPYHDPPDRRRDTEGPNRRR